MSQELDGILISSDTPQWHERLRAIQHVVRQATYFKDGSKEDIQLDAIIEGVKTRKNRAILEYTEKFDAVVLRSNDLRIRQEDLQLAHNKIEADNASLMGSVRRAIANVRKYQSEIFGGVSKICSGGTGIRYTALKRVGICVPAASAPLPSTVIMTAVPAQIAGVQEIAVVSPPRFEGSIHPVILAVCHELGISEVYRIGGAQAVGALAFGTETIKAVDKIVGPGNRWVQMAKRKVFGVVDIDSVAGPSEVLIIADENANPVWIAADMLSQAEHAPGSAVVFTDSQMLAQQILNEVKQQAGKLKRAKETIGCLKKYSGIIVFERMEEAITQADYFAAEHLEIQCGSSSHAIAERIHNAGAIFIGRYSPVAVGDYFAGPSHTLPTGQTAKFFSAVTANDFVKSTSLIEYDKEKLLKSAADIIRLAEIEGLDAHANSVRLRQQQ